MRCKVFSILLLLYFVGINIGPVSANSAAPKYSIVVIFEECSASTDAEYPKVDVLINKDTHDSNIEENINATFKALFPDYHNYDYMNEVNSEWISYEAYYENADVSHGPCSYELVDVLSFDSPILEIKIIHYNDQGETIFLSDIIEIIPEIDGNGISGNIIFNTTTFEITNTIRNKENYFPGYFDYILILGLSYWGSIFLIPVLIMFSSLIETLIAVLFKFKLKMVLTILGLNVFTQLIMFMLFGTMNYPYAVTLIILEFFIYMFEFLVLTLMFNKINKKKILIYVFVANTVTLLLGSILGLY